MKSPCLFLCLCYFVIGSYGSDNLVPFIEKCEASDKACLRASTAKAIPYIAGGLLGIEAIDPLQMDKVTFKESGLRVKLTNMSMTGLSKCKVINVERDIKKNLLRLEFEYPIDVAGEYDVAGDLLLLKIEGNGPFHVNCESIHFKADIELTTEVGKDGVKYWKVGKTTYTHEARKPAKFHFENLFNGNQKLAEPVLRLMNENWQQMMQTFGNPLVDKAVYKTMNCFRSFCAQVPADQLEK